MCVKTNFKLYLRQKVEKISRSIDLDIFVYVLAAPEAIEEDVGNHSDDDPIGSEISGNWTNEVVLDEWHDTTTYYHGHEEARSLGGIFAQSFGREVEDAAPHDGGAETAEEDEEARERYFATEEGDIDVAREDGTEQEEDSY